ncbi:N-6 DNA methylase [Tenacibaculum discolor]|uniref:N-6 DNA methylase n=1 Tax=Tenacibaculum discolor TaxID=361581 RepID=UPI000EB500C2|nr:N-6 DNA methylase [Tenacibaculum discolor]RLJ98802.1 type I restriction enzyme M protein [Tenacibaculum discolor]
MNNSLGQYYTQENISRLLISKILVKNPKKIIELGIGDGSLIRVAQDKWKDSKIIGGDIDPENVKSLKTEFPNLNLFLINGLSSKLSQNLKIELGTIDVGICNPPYLKIKKNGAVKSIIENCNLGKLDSYPIITSDLVFLAQNLLLIRNGGELGIILPDGLITSHHFKHFRKQLINNYEITGIIELPDKVFKKTEAKTHILVIRKNKVDTKKTPIYLSDKDGKIIDKVEVNKTRLIHRMDYSYNKWLVSNENHGATLLDIKAKIFRGKFSKKELTLSKHDFIHTSNLSKSISYQSFKPNKRLLKKFNCAKKGDIIIPRVGKRCLGRVMVIESGAVLISDCLYVIRVEKKYQKILIDSLTNEKGKKWIEANSHGVCARVISKIDLLNFRINEDLNIN